MNNLSFIPKTKFDLNACSILADTSNEEIEPYIAELLEWLQDTNWPVAGHVSMRLQNVGVELAPEIVKVLKGKDNTWKYHLLSSLLLDCKSEVRALCMNEVVRIINSPSSAEKEEEVDMVAKDVMIKYSYDA